MPYQAPAPTRFTAQDLLDFQRTGLGSPTSRGGIPIIGGPNPAQEAYAWAGQREAAQRENDDRNYLRQQDETGRMEERRRFDLGREDENRRLGQRLDVFKGIFAQPETQMQPANAFARRRPMMADSIGGENEQNALVRYLRQMGVL